MVVGSNFPHKTLLLLAEATLHLVLTINASALLYQLCQSEPVSLLLHLLQMLRWPQLLSLSAHVLVALATLSGTRQVWRKLYVGVERTTRKKHAC